MVNFVSSWLGCGAQLFGQAGLNVAVEVFFMCE